MTPPTKEKTASLGTPLSVASAGLGCAVFVFATGFIILCHCSGWFLFASLLALAPVVRGRGLIRLAGLCVCVASFLMGVSRAFELEPGRVRAQRSQLRGQLRNLASAEEAFFADSIRYSADVAPLALAAIPGIAITIDSATGTGYRARARWLQDSVDTGGRVGVCILWVGDSSLALPTVPEGQTSCWIHKRSLWRFGSYEAPAWR